MPALARPRARSRTFGCARSVLRRRLGLDRPIPTVASPTATPHQSCERAHRPRSRSPERSPSGLWRRTGNAVRGNPSRVQIPPSPPPSFGAGRRGRALAPCGPRSRTLGCARCGPPVAAFAGDAPRRTPAMSLRRRPTVIPIAISEFRFRDPALADRIGVVNSYVVRHAAGVVVVDTGFGTGDPDIDAAYAPRTRPLAEALAEAGVAIDEVTDVVNCHLHVDHAGQNGVLPGVPIHVQSTELAASWTPDYTIPSWIHAPGTSYVETEGDHDVVAGVGDHRDARSHGGPSVGRRRVGWRPDRARGPGGLQRRRVDRRSDGPRRPKQCRRSGRLRSVVGAPARAGPGGGPCRARSRGMDPMTGLVERPCYPSRAVLGGELAVPCSLQSAPAGPNPLSRSPFSDAARRCDVEDRVPRSDEPRTVSGPEGSSTKRSSSGAAERPGPSRPSRWARKRVDRRRVHGNPDPLAPDRRRS